MSIFVMDNVKEMTYGVTTVRFNDDAGAKTADAAKQSGAADAPATRALSLESIANALSENSLVISRALWTGAGFVVGLGLFNLLVHYKRLKGDWLLS